VNKEAIVGYAEALVASVTIQVIVPLLMFLMMLAAFWYLLHKAQKKTDFHIEQVFIDPATGKTSAQSVATLMALAYSVWYMTVLALSGKQGTQEFFYFLLFWSGAPVALEVARKWDGRLPWAKSTDSQGP
jgi:hypothetical protein